MATSQHPRDAKRSLSRGARRVVGDPRVPMRGEQSSYLLRNIFSEYSDKRSSPEGPVLLFSLGGRRVTLDTERGTRRCPIRVMTISFFELGDRDHGPSARRGCWRKLYRETETAVSLHQSTIRLPTKRTSVVKGPMPEAGAESRKLNFSNQQQWRKWRLIPGPTTHFAPSLFDPNKLRESPLLEGVWTIR